MVWTSLIVVFHAEYVHRSMAESHSVSSHPEQFGNHKRIESTDENAHLHGVDSTWAKELVQKGKEEGRRQALLESRSEVKVEVSSLLKKLGLKAELTDVSGEEAAGGKGTKALKNKPLPKLPPRVSRILELRYRNKRKLKDTSKEVILNELHELLEKWRTSGGDLKTTEVNKVQILIDQVALWGVKKAPAKDLIIHASLENSQHDPDHLRSAEKKFKVTQKALEKDANNPEACNCFTCEKNEPCKDCNSCSNYEYADCEGTMTYGCWTTGENNCQCDNPDAGISSLKVAESIAQGTANKPQPGLIPVRDNTHEFCKIFIPTGK